jgi:hypothetical protein
METSPNGSTDMPTTLGIVSLVVGAVGAGVQYAGAQSAAKATETLALLNAQAQTQAIEQSGQVNQMQAAINTRLAEKDKAAADANASMLAQQTELNSKASRDATRRGRAEAGEFSAMQVASLAKGGFADTTGSPLALLGDTWHKAQQGADNERFADEQARRLGAREVSAARNQGVLAGLNVQSQRLSGMAAKQEATARLAQNRMDLAAQRANASAARTGAGASLLNSMGGLAYQGYNTFRTSPRTS